MDNYYDENDFEDHFRTYGHPSFEDYEVKEYDDDEDF